MKNPIKWTQWFIAYQKFNSRRDFSFERFIPLIPPKDRFWADPMSFEKDGVVYIFVEESIYSNPKGRISYFTVESSGKAKGPFTAIEESFHLAYPFIFKHDNRIFMIPTTKNNGLRLYEAKSFPSKWTHVKNITNHKRLVDSTIIKHNQLWWIFTSIPIQNEPNPLKLSIFYSNDPLSDWTEFSGKIQVPDINNSRSAGGFLKINNDIYRLSQNTGKTYGESMNINKVINFSTEEYEETVSFRINPTWLRGIKKTHTFNISEHSAVIDGKLMRNSFYRLKDYKRFFFNLGILQQIR